MVHPVAGKPPGAGEMANPAEAAGFLIHCAGELDRAPRERAFLQDRLNRDQGGSNPAFHIAGAAAIDPPVLHHPFEGWHRQPRPASTTSIWH